VSLDQKCARVFGLLYLVTFVTSIVAPIDREYEAAVAAGAILSGSERVAADIALVTQRLLADCDHSLEELAADLDLAWMVNHDLFLAAYEAGVRAATPISTV
jgi:hypothetical protein